MRNSSIEICDGLLPHDRFLLDICLEFVDGIKQIGEQRVHDVCFANGAHRKGETNAWSDPTFLEHRATAVIMKYVAAHQLNSRSAGQRFHKANHTHVVGVLRQFWLLQRFGYVVLAFVANYFQTWQAFRFVENATTWVPAKFHFCADICCVLLTFGIGAHVAHCQQARIAYCSAKSATTC